MTDQKKTKHLKLVSPTVVGVQETQLSQGNLLTSEAQTLITEVSLFSFFIKVYPLRICTIFAFSIPFLLLTLMLTLSFGWTYIQGCILVATTLLSLYLFGCGDGIVYRNPFGSNTICVRGPTGTRKYYYGEFLNGETYHYDWIRFSENE
jgi:hypothetical protein